MLTQHDPRIKRRGLWYRDGIATYDRPKVTRGWIYFPSTAEFNCYKKLSRWFGGYTIRIHPKLRTSIVDWKLDFEIVANSTSQQEKLAKIVNVLSVANFSALDSIFIEYKGYRDKNFRVKLGMLYEAVPMMYQKILFVSNERSEHYFRCRGKKIKKDIYSLNNLEDLCKMVLT